MIYRQCRGCGTHVIARTIQTTVPGTSPVIVKICPTCDRIRCEVCKRTELTGVVRECCGKKLGTFAPAKRPRRG